MNADASALHPLEVTTLRALASQPGREWAFDEIVSGTKLDEAQVRSAIEWLKMKGLVDLACEKEYDVALLTETAIRYAEHGPPEQRLLSRIKDSPVEIGALSEDERMCMGALKGTGALRVAHGQVSRGEEAPFQSALQQAKNLRAVCHALREDGQLEYFLERFTDPDAGVVRAGAQRRGKEKGPFEIKKRTARSYRLTAQGRALAEALPKDDVSEVNRLTPEMLKDGGWRKVRFRRYATGLKPARKVAGRAHPYRAFLDGVRGKLLALGFEEMTGPLVESEFWNMDALFMPQFHPAREIHDAYYLAEPTHGGDQPPDLVERVAAAHERGEGTGGKGWGYDFDRRRTRRLVLRSQGTSLSARTLAAIGARAPERRGDPGKYFAIARCFRYDQVDATHAPDFLQVEGIVLGPGIHLRHLLGLLELFAREMARAKAIRFAPAYFPFTEPSVEVHMQHPELGWMELGGAGIFRPEVTRPLGVEVPVIAWGLGLDRMAMVALGIQDIRDLFSPDLELLRGRVPPPPT